MSAARLGLGVRRSIRLALGRHRRGLRDASSSRSWVDDDQFVLLAGRADVERPGMRRIGSRVCESCSGSRGRCFVFPHPWRRALKKNFLVFSTAAAPELLRTCTEHE